MRGEDAGDNPSAWAEIFLQSMERSHSGAGEEGEAEGVKLLWTEQNLHFLLNPWRRRWRIPEWRSASEKGKGERFFSFCLLLLTIQLYFNLQYIKFMLPKFSLFCYDGNWQVISLSWPPKFFCLILFLCLV